MQLNYLIEHHGFVYDEHSQKFSVDMERIEQAVSDLTRDIMLIQGNGDKQAAQAFRDKYGVVSEPVRLALESMKHVPIDIAPVWVDIKELRAQYQN
ncbi:hypothetical protein EV176_007101 [Coemansia sp. RSA 451]|nr:hypothetical protein EV176_007101 [Coemansia sp. RSA 451]